ncbi:MAG TPA: Ig domain-containing protein, partial [bacterium]|nr:Ig domain-containing protein [bacterium]
SREFTVTLLTDIECEPVEILNERFPDPVLGQAYNAALLASGVGPFTWELAFGSLPDGITVDPTGSLTGTPNNPEQVGTTFIFSLLVTDSCPDGAQTDQEEFSFTLLEALECEPPVQLTTESLPDAAIDTPYSVQIEAEGGVEPYDFDLASGELPSGLTLSDSGLLAGTPDDPADAGETFVVGIQVTDSCPFRPGTDLRNYSLFVQPIGECESLPEITTTEVPPAFIGDPYNATVEASGGEGDLTFAITAGELPSGLTLDAAGNITGTPNNPEDAGGTFTFDVTVTDECPFGPNSDTQTLSIVVGDIFCEEVEILNQSFPDPVLDQAYNAALLASGIDPKTWSLVDGSLPTGLTVDPTGFLTGTPTNGEEVGQDFTFTLRVEDSCVKGPQVDEKTFSFTLQAAACEPPVQLTSESLPDAAIDTPYSVQIEAEGGVEPYDFDL